MHEIIINNYLSYELFDLEKLTPEFAHRFKDIGNILGKFITFLNLIFSLKSKPLVLVKLQFPCT